MEKFKKKYLIISTIVIVLCLSYIFKKKAIYRWSCDSENVGPSCLILGRILEEEKKFNEALIYFEKSCQKKYIPGCKKLEEIYFKTRNKIKLKETQYQICKLSNKKNC